MLPDSSLLIRRAELCDTAAIAEIDNEAILTMTATFDKARKSGENRHEWLRDHGERHPVLVAIVDGRVEG